MENKVLKTQLEERAKKEEQKQMSSMEVSQVKGTVNCKGCTSDNLLFADCINCITHYSLIYPYITCGCN